MRIRESALNVVALFIGLSIAVGASEALLRVSYRAPWYMQLVSEQGRGERLPYRRNEFGLRDRDYPTTKPSSTRRVLVLGDSFTFGFGVASDSAVFPRVLERMLRQTVPTEGTTHVEVLNGGLVGSLTGDWVSLLNKVIDPFKPDVVLVVFFLRDGTRLSAMASFFGPIRKKIVQRNMESRSYRFLYSYRLLQDYLDRRKVAELYAAEINAGYSGNAAERTEWLLAQENLLRIADITKSHGATMGLAIFPILADLNADYPFTAICDTITAFAVKNSIPVHSLLPAFDGHAGPELWVSTYDQHPNETGHAIAARSLLPFTRDLLEMGTRDPTRVMPRPN